MKSARIILFLIITAFFSLSTESFAQINKVVALLKGTVTTPSGGPAADVSIAFFKGSERINATKSTPDGKFTQILQPGTQYRVTFSGGKYYYHEEMLSVPQSDVYQTVPMTVSLKALDIGSPFAFSNLIFEPKSSEISSAVMPDMENIASAMKHNPKLTVNITVYPDEAPSGKKSAMQNSLAESRKSALMSFFLSKNIASSSVMISVSANVPSNGTFERMVTSDPPVAAKGKKTKKKAPAPSASAKKMMVPQYAQIVMQLS